MGTDQLAKPGLWRGTAAASLPSALLESSRHPPPLSLHFAGRQSPRPGWMEGLGCGSTWVMPEPREAVEPATPCASLALVPSPLLSPDKHVPWPSPQMPACRPPAQSPACLGCLVATCLGTAFLPHCQWPPCGGRVTVTWHCWAELWGLPCFLGEGAWRGDALGTEEDWMGGAEP